MPKKAVYTTLFISWVLLVTVLSLFDFDPNDEGIPIPYLDKLVHFVFYLLFVILGGLMWQSGKPMPATLKKTILWVVIAVLYGLLMEALQDLLPIDRSAEIFDVLANTLGAVMGGLLIKTYFSRTHALK